MPQTNQLRVKGWNFGYVDLLTQLGIASAVPPMQADVTFSVDCTSGSMTVTAVSSVNGDTLLPAGTVQQRGTLALKDPLTPNQSYATTALVTLDNFSSFLDVEQGLLWANCAPATNGNGVPRFGLRVRSGLTYSAKTLLFTQVWDGRNWSAPNAQASAIDHGIQTQIGDWSDMQQREATIAPCAKCLQMPIGAPMDAWNWGMVKRFPLSPSTATPPAVLVSYS